MEQKTYEPIGAVVLGLVALLLTPFRETLQKWSKDMIARLFNKKEPEAPFGAHHAEREKRINIIVTELRYETDADRAYIFKFHNGEYFSPSDPLWKLTCTNEVVRTSIAYTYQTCRAMLVSSVIDLLLPLFGDKDVFGAFFVDKENCPCTDKCAEIRHVCFYDVRMMAESSTKSLLIERGSHFTILAPLMRGNNIVGFIGVDYCSEGRQNEVMEYAQTVCHASNQVSLYVNAERIDARN